MLGTALQTLTSGPPPPGGAPRLVVPRELSSDLAEGTRREWLETNGLGSFAMGTVAGPATRRYHGLLCVATRPPVGRMMLVGGTEEVVELDGTHAALSAHFYPGVVYPEGHLSLVDFRLDPWPTWRYRVGEATFERTLFMPHGRQMTIVSWTITGAARARLHVRPLVSGRDYHQLHRENDAIRRSVVSGEGLVELAPYPGVPRLYLHHNGRWVDRPDWYRRFQYPAEAERGLDCEEDLFAPGELGYTLTPAAPARLVLSTEGAELPDVVELTARELARRANRIEDPFQARLVEAAERFVVTRGAHRTVIAGYPWFTDWGRDTFISLPGLARALGSSLERELVEAFATHLDRGLVPNRFPDGGPPEYNTADAPLWFALRAARHDELVPAARAVVDGYLAGTRHGIGVDDDGLVHAASPGLALTWMDARVGEWVVTPREGKPVEVQALWVALLETLAKRLAASDPAYATELGERAAWARSSFAAAFFCEERGWLYDVVDGSRRDATLRPNQLYALGLVAPLVTPERAESALAACERELLTPVGLRSRARGDGYIGQMTGEPRKRDGAYHNGAVWPFLLGIYADACMRVRGRVDAHLLDGVRAHVLGPGLGQLCEVFDGDAPHAPRGCPAQAWSVAEVLRVAMGAVAEDG